MNLLIFNALSWEQRKLGDLGSLKNGMNFSKDAMGHGYAFVNLQNIFGNNVVEAKSLGLAEASEKQLLEYSLQKGDVLFVRSSVKLEGVGEVALVAENLENTTYSGFIIRFRDGYGLNNDFKKFVFATKKVRDQIMSQATNSANKNISQSVLENLTFEIPSKDEQKQIGEFFSNLDNLITLHQSKAESWKNKKNQLSTISWEQRKLGDIADVTKLAGFEFTEHVVYSDEGNIIALRGLNIKNGQLVLDDVKYIDGSNFAKLNRSKLFIDDIMFTYVGTVGEVAIIKENDRFYLAPNVSRIRVQSNDSSKFISHYMRTDSFYRHVIFPLIATSSQPALSMENIRKFEICLPKNRDEQDKLSEFFDGIDNLITLHQSKAESWKNKKNQLLTISWEQRKLAELLTRYEDPVETPHDGYIRLGIRSHAKGTFHEYVEPGHELETAQMHRVAANKLIFNITFAWEHAVAITTEDDAGKLVSHRFPQFSLSELLRPEFLKYVILDEGFHHKLYLASPGGAGRNRVLKVDEALDYSIFFPSVEEQHKLGEFLNQLNDLITLHQSELEKLQKIKKSLLERMFV